MLFSKDVEDLLGRCDSISLLDPKYKNFKFIDEDFFSYESKEKSVIIKEAELSDSAK
jgi:hypothetical protein